MFSYLLDPGARKPWVPEAEELDRCVEDVTRRKGHGDDGSGTRSVHALLERSLIDERHLLIDPPGTPEGTATDIVSRYHRGLT